MIAKRFRDTTVLVIDEVSMLPGEYFTCLDIAARTARKSDKFMGGMKLLCVGDFGQLPPVDKEGNGRFCFETVSWRKGIKDVVTLDRPFRQSVGGFFELLQRVRVGNMRKGDWDMLNGAVGR